MLSDDEVKQFAGRMAAFINAADWVIMAMPFGKLPFLLYPTPTHRLPGIVEDLNADNVNPANALRDSSGYPTELAHIYYG